MARLSQVPRTGHRLHAGQRGFHLRDLALPRQEHQHITGMRCQRMLDRTLRLMLDGFLASRGEMRDFDRIAAAGAAQARRVEEPGKPLAIQRRRHHHDAQVLAQAGLYIQRQRQAKVAGQVAFVEFVEQQRADAFQHRVVLQHAGEDALGDHLDPRARADLVLETDAVADGFADRFAKLPGHEAGGSARGDAAWFQHHELAATQPLGIQQRQRHLGGLACAWRRFQHQSRVVLQRRTDRWQQGLDRENGSTHAE